MSLVERGGKTRSFKLNGVSRYDILPFVDAHVHPDTVLHTDGAQHYKFTRPVGRHEAVDHNKKYVRTTKRGVNDVGRADIALKGMKGKRLTYRTADCKAPSAI